MKTQNWIRKSLQYIDDHLEGPLSVKEIALWTGYSEAYFSRQFRKTMDMPVMDYVNRRKLLRAAKEICSGQKVLDAAIRFGWESHSGFTRAFKKEFGFTPALLQAMKISMDSLGGKNMGGLFLKNMDEHATKENLFDALNNEMVFIDGSRDKKLLKICYDYAVELHRGKVRYSGDEYITHPLHVALILAQLETDIHVICAGLFCVAWEVTEISPGELEERLPRKVASLVEKLKVSSRELTALEDEDVLLIKLAQHLHNMRTIEFLSENARARHAKETLEVFVPLCRKLGIPQMVDEFDYLAGKYY